MKNPSPTGHTLYRGAFVGGLANSTGTIALSLQVSGPRSGLQTPGEDMYRFTMSQWKKKHRGRSLPPGPNAGRVAGNMRIQVPSSSGGFRNYLVGFSGQLKGLKLKGKLDSEDAYITSETGLAKGESGNVRVEFKDLVQGKNTLKGRIVLNVHQFQTSIPFVMEAFHVNENVAVLGVGEQKPKSKGGSETVFPSLRKRAIRNLVNKKRRKKGGIFGRFGKPKPAPSPDMPTPPPDPDMGAPSEDLGAEEEAKPGMTLGKVALLGLGVLGGGAALYASTK